MSRVPSETEMRTEQVSESQHSVCQLAEATASQPAQHQAIRAVALWAAGQRGLRERPALRLHWAMHHQCLTVGPPSGTLSFPPGLKATLSQSTVCFVWKMGVGSEDP